MINFSDRFFRGRCVCCKFQNERIYNVPATPPMKSASPQKTQSLVQSIVPSSTPSFEPGEERSSKQGGVARVEGRGDCDCCGVIQGTQWGSVASSCRMSLGSPPDPARLQPRPPRGRSRIMLAFCLAPKYCQFPVSRVRLER